MEGIEISKRPKLKEPYLIVAWPGMGEVAYKNATYLVDKLQAEEFAQMPPEDFFYLTGSVIEKGVLTLPVLPFNKFYYWKNKTGIHDLLIFISNAQPDLAKSDVYCKRIISFARNFKVKRVIGFAAMPVAIDHLQAPGVWFSGTSQRINEELKKHNLHHLLEGQISGLNGLFLGLAKKEGVEGFCLLGEIPLYTIQIENPKASYAALEALSRILEIKIDFSTLLEQAQHTEDEINRLLDYLKLDLQGQAHGPIGEQDIEKIKRSLSQLTKLPVSVKENIERLFKEAKSNISKAGELKAELDRWNAYKEYEDRFLDLFKKSKDKDN